MPYQNKKSQFSREFSHFKNFVKKHGLPLSDSERVREFTGKENCQNTPTVMNKAEVQFIIGMVVSELVELAQTVVDADEAKKMITSSVDIDLNENYSIPTDEDELIGDQIDAAADIYIYLLDAFGKKGVNLSKVFNIVHESNMNKRFPEDGKFHYREDGKKIKPPSWQPPDIKSEIVRQKKYGAWNEPTYSDEKLKVIADYEYKCYLHKLSNKNPEKRKYGLKMKNIGKINKHFGKEFKLEINDEHSISSNEEQE